MLLDLQKGVLYGPVNSRRLGRSLGVNLMPAEYKLCSFNCVYCHYGWTKKLTGDAAGSLKDLPRLDEVVKALEAALKSPLDFSFVTFSGNGEPTLHPGFAELVEAVVELRDAPRPEVKIALLSNSTGLRDDHVRASILKLDQPVFKLDAGDEATFRAVNRPAAGVSWFEIVERLTALPGIFLQTVLIEGRPSNVTPEGIKAYFEQVARIKAQEVHIYSIDRPVPNERISLVSPSRLKDIARQGERETGARFKAFYLGG